MVRCHVGGAWQLVGGCGALACEGVRRWPARAVQPRSHQLCFFSRAGAWFLCVVSMCGLRASCARGAGAGAGRIGPLISPACVLVERGRSFRFSSGHARWRVILAFNSRRSARGMAVLPVATVGAALVPNDAEAAAGAVGSVGGAVVGR